MFGGIGTAVRFLWRSSSLCWPPMIRTLSARPYRHVEDAVVFAIVVPELELVHVIAEHRLEVRDGELADRAKLDVPSFHCASSSWSASCHQSTVVSQGRYSPYLGASPFQAFRRA